MSTETAWRVPASHPALDRCAVHVWRASLHATAQQIETLRGTLSDDEIARADRLRLEKKRNEFIVAWGALRAILGRYLDVRPASLAFSGDWLLCAFAAGRQVGVDIERRHPVELEAIIRRFFAAGERAAMQSLPEERKLAAFFRFWTLKEAYVKAQGIGLSYPLDQFEVMLTPNGPRPRGHLLFRPARQRRKPSRAVFTLPGAFRAQEEFAMKNDWTYPILVLFAVLPEVNPETPRKSQGPHNSEIQTRVSSTQKGYREPRTLIAYGVLWSYPDGYDTVPRGNSHKRSLPLSRAGSLHCRPYASIVVKFYEIDLCCHLQSGGVRIAIDSRRERDTPKYSAHPLGRP
jgi:4'-phosphopantetheinyl transferase